MIVLALITGPTQPSWSQDAETGADITYFDNYDGTYTIKFDLTTPGAYTINVAYAGVRIAGGEFAFNVVVGRAWHMTRATSSCSA